VFEVRQSWHRGNIALLRRASNEADSSLRSNPDRCEIASESVVTFWAGFCGRLHDDAIRVRRREASE
jgi:hypothetical protein